MAESLAQLDMAKMSVDDALAHIATHFETMPPVAALQLRIAGYDGECLRLTAPLSAHVNDKGCAFGGSMVSLMTLAAWGLVTLRVRQAGCVADVFVADSQVRYLAPLFADLEVEARLSPTITDVAVAWTEVLARLRERGRTSVLIDACVRLPDGTPAATMRARYVAVTKG